MEIWVLALAIVLAGAMVAAVIYFRLPGSAEADQEAERVREMRAENMESSVSNLITTQAELAGRVGQLAEAHVKAQTGMMKALEDRLDAVKLYMGRSLSEQTTRTNDTLTQLQTRLSMIDEAQKNITELSGHVGSLQDILSNKHARGAFGEMQMADIVSMALPPSAYTFKKVLSNGETVDCMIDLPMPPGSIAIDTKFPLDTYHALRDANTEADRQQAERAFRNAVLKHVVDIAERYIVANETAESALMFLPSEAVYAELHSKFSDVIEKSFRARVWIVSPTTLMATLNTVRAILKDARMREAAQAIQKEVSLMTDDVARMQKRVLNLQAHFGQTEKDIREILISADKIARRSERIEEINLGEQDASPAVAKTSSPAIEAPKPQAPVAATPKTEAPKFQTPKFVPPKFEAPKAAAAAAPKPFTPPFMPKPAPTAATPAKPLAPVAPTAPTQKGDAPKTEAPKFMTPKVETPKPAAPASAPKTAAGTKDPAQVWAELWLSAMNTPPKTPETPKQAAPVAKTEAAPAPAKPAAPAPFIPAKPAMTPSAPAKPATTMASSPFAPSTPKPVAPKPIAPIPQAFTPSREPAKPAAPKPYEAKPAQPQAFKAETQKAPETPKPAAPTMPTMPVWPFMAATRPSMNKSAENKPAESKPAEQPSTTTASWAPQAPKPYEAKPAQPAPAAPKAPVWPQPIQPQKPASAQTPSMPKSPFPAQPAAPKPFEAKPAQPAQPSATTAPKPQPSIFGMPTFPSANPTQKAAAPKPPVAKAPEAPKPAAPAPAKPAAPTTATPAKPAQPAQAKSAYTPVGPMWWSAMPMKPDTSKSMAPAPAPKPYTPPMAPAAPAKAEETKSEAPKTAAPAPGVAVTPTKKAVETTPTFADMAEELAEFGVPLAPLTLDEDASKAAPKAPAAQPKSIEVPKAAPAKPASSAMPQQAVYFPSAPAPAPAKSLADNGASKPGASADAGKKTSSPEEPDFDLDFDDRPIIWPLV